MSRRPNVSEALAMRAAAAAAAQEDVEDEKVLQIATPSPAPKTPETAAERGRGRPKGKRLVAARQTIYLDQARHDALSRIAEDRGRSIHSLIIEGIDQVIGKPTRAGWQ